jgi:hypothetical protein
MLRARVTAALWRKMTQASAVSCAATAAARSRGMQEASSQMPGLDDGDAQAASSCVNREETRERRSEER